MKETRLEGFFLEFSAEEAAYIRKELEVLGYKPDNEGMKEFLIENLFYEDDGEPEESATEKFVRNARNYVLENPDKVKMGIDAVVGLVKMAGKARR